MAEFLRVYLLCLATFGLYGLYWVYRNARDVARRDPSDALAWALGFLAAPIACAILFELPRASQRLENPRARAGWASWVSAGLYGVLSSLLLIGPLSMFWSPIWLVLPIPLAIVAWQVARSPRVDPGPMDRSRRGARIAQAAAVLVGVPIVAWASFEIDGPSLRYLLASQRVDVVAGSHLPYEFEVTDRSWRRVPPGTIGDETADLELITSDRQSWFVVYTHGPKADIDSVVDVRRSMIEAEGLESFVERRYMASDESLVPVSLAQYRLGATQLVETEFLVLTAKLEGGIVEAVGFTAAPSVHSGALQNVAEGFRIRPDVNWDAP